LAGIFTSKIDDCWPSEFILRVDTTSSSRPAEGKEEEYIVSERERLLERLFFANMTTHRHHRDALLSASSHEDEGRQQVPETTFEYYSDGILATAFLIIAILAAKR
jgi:hypothetical protein